MVREIKLIKAYAFLIVFSVFVSVLCLLFVADLCPLSSVTYAANVLDETSEGESMNTLLHSDRVIEGKIDELSPESLAVDGVEFPFCSKVRVYDLRNGLVSFQSLEMATKVKIFFSKQKSCVRKVIIIQSAR